MLTDKELENFEKELCKCLHCGTWFNMKGASSFAEFACDVCNHNIMKPHEMGGFWLYKAIGEGGMGRVYLSQRPYEPHLYAIKIAEYQDECDFCFQSLLYEGKIILNLEHRALPTAHHFGYKNNQAFLVMDYIQGSTLDKFIANSEIFPIPDRLLVSWSLQLVEVLKFLDSKDYIYRDLKPQNIIIDGQNLSLIDFGLAMHKSYTSQIDEENLIGSPAYIPPERIRQQSETILSDIYSLGMIFYYAAAGEDYFEAYSHQEIIKLHLSTKREKVENLLPELNIEYCRIIDKLIQMKPTNRYQNYDDLYNDLASCYEKIS